MRRLLVPVELALHRRDVDHEAPSFIRRAILQHRYEFRIDDEGRQGVDREDLGQLGCGDLVDFLRPRVVPPQVELFTQIGVAVRLSGREGRIVAHVVAGRDAEQRS